MFKKEDCLICYLFNQTPHKGVIPKIEICKFLFEEYSTTFAAADGLLIISASE